MILSAIMAEMANHAEAHPWPSLEWAGWIFDRASFVLIASLIVGAMATVAIVNGPAWDPKDVAPIQIIIGAKP
jgi:hypothetical protein